MSLIVRKGCSLLAHCLSLPTGEKGRQLTVKATCQNIRMGGLN